MLAPLLRAGDTQEIAALGKEPLPALQESIVASDEAYAVFFGGEIGALFGVETDPAPTLGAPKLGLIWMLSGRAAGKHPRDFLRWSRIVVSGLLSRYDALFNAIDARYTGALRWAEWLGFELEEPRPFGPLGMPFCRFSVRREPNGSWRPL